MNIISTRPAGGSKSLSVSSMNTARQPTDPTPKENLSSIAVRTLSVLTGGGIVAGLAYTSLSQMPPNDPASVLVVSLAAGVFVGSIVAPRAPLGMAMLIVFALLAGESFNLLSTAERIVTAREGAAAKVTGTNAAYQDAKDRLDAAIKAQLEYRTRAASSAALPGCLNRCAALLGEEAKTIEAEVVAARVAFENAPAKKSATPLADRLGLAPWVLDLVAAAMLSLGANGLAACLIAFGARPGSAERPRTLASNDVGQAQAVNPPNADAGLSHTVRDTTGLTVVTPPDDDGPKGGVPVPVSDRTRGLLRLIEGNGGQLQGSQRALAEKVGVSKSVLNRALQELRDAGDIDLHTDKLAGTVIRLRTA